MMIQDAQVEIDASTASPTVQTCTKCGRTKPLSEYKVETRIHANGERYPYLFKQCRECLNAAKREERNRRNARRNGPAVRISADNRTGGRKIGPANSGQYHFDTRFVKRLQRIARVLDRENWRSPNMLTLVDNQQLAAAGMQMGDIQVLRKAQVHQDRNMFYFIFDEPLTKQIRPVLPVQEPVEPDEQETVDVADTAEADYHDLPDVFDEPGQPEPDWQAPLPMPETRQPEPDADAGATVQAAVTVLDAETLTDDDIEAAAEMIVATRAKLTDLHKALREYEDIVANLRLQIREAEQERQSAINLMRRA